MSDPRIDPERLAALADGRLAPREREALLNELAASEEDVEALADLSAVLAELERDERQPVAGSGAPPADVVPFRPAAPTAVPPAQRRRTPWAALAAAAVLVIAVGIGVQRRAGGPPFDAPADLVAQLDPPAAGDAAIAPLIWNGARGTMPLADAARAHRVGARVFTLELAVARGDTSAGTLAAQVAAQLRDVPGGAPAAAAYARLVDGSATADARRAALDAGWQASAELLGAEPLRRGAWLAGAREAAAARDVAYFRTRAAQRVLDGLREARDLSPTDARTVDALRRVAGGAAPDWDSLGRGVTALLETLGGSAVSP